MRILILIAALSATPLISVATEEGKPAQKPSQKRVLARDKEEEEARKKQSEAAIKLAAAEAERIRVEREMLQEREDIQAHFDREYEQDHPPFNSDEDTPE